MRFILPSLLFFFSLVLSFEKLHAQENFLSGFVIQPGGDTLRGFVDYKNWDRSPKSISFRENSGAVARKYSPLDIKGFGVADEYYASMVADIEVSSVNPGSLDRFPDLKFRSDTAFVQSIVLGEKSLYYHKTLFGKELFYIKNQDHYELLIYKRYTKVQDGLEVVTENKRYIGQLISYLREQPALKTKIQNARYEKESLEKIFTAFYGDATSQPVFKKKTEKISLQISALAGLTLTSISFDGSAYTYLKNGNFPQTSNFAVGLGFDFVFPRNNGKWSINNELVFGSYKVNGFSTTNTTFSGDFLKINNMMRYRIITGQTSVYLNAGVSNEILLSEKNRKVNTSEQAMNNWKTYLFDISAGAGLKVKSFSFETRFETGDGLADKITGGSTFSRIYFLFGYTFRK